MDTYQQVLRFASISMDQSSATPAPYMLSGRKMYVLGTTDAAFRPIGDEHLVGEMGGVWTHPVRWADGWFMRIHDAAGSHTLNDCQDFEGHLSDVEFRFTHGPLRITRTEVVSEEHAALWSLVEIRNTGAETWRGRLGCLLQVRIRPAWFSGWETGTPRLHVEGGLVVGYDDLWQGRWGLAFGGSEDPHEVAFGDDDQHPTVELGYDFELAPGAQHRWEFMLTADHQNGHHGARQLWTTLVGTGQAALADKRALYARIAAEGVTLEAPDAQLVAEYQLAKINLHMLTADYGPYLSGYFLAGVPEYPQLFGCDTAYSIAGATAAGFAATARSALSILGEYAHRAAGRVPHEITTNGRIFHPGNTQETPQFALAVWDYVRWTGDLAFLRLMYPICREGVMEYVTSLWDYDRDGYPQGDAMVERTGMGPLKLDSACYLYAAWQALACMAEALKRPEAASYRERAADWRVRFEQDWWIPEAELYADSLHADHQPQLDGHWTQITPVQLGIAAPDRAQRVLDEIQRSFVNQYGLMHTRGREDHVWTLPTGLLALACFRWGRLEEAVAQLHNIGRTVHSRMLGMFEELIPEGICFAQLWSAAIYLQGIVEGVLGLDPLAHEHRLRVEPHLTERLPSATLRGLRIGEHTVTLSATRSSITVIHERGMEPLVVEYTHAGTRVAEITVIGAPAEAAMLQQGEQSATVQCVLEPSHMFHLICTEAMWRVAFADGSDNGSMLQPYPASAQVSHDVKGG